MLASKVISDDTSEETESPGFMRAKCCPGLFPEASVGLEAPYKIDPDSVAQGDNAETAGPMVPIACEPAYHITLDSGIQGNYTDGAVKDFSLR